MTAIRLVPFVLLLASSAVPAQDRPDVVFADFEGETHGAWVAEGKAFGPGPAAGTLPNQMHVSGFQGKRLASSFHGGDPSTGTLTSPEFRIERNYVKFLIGGGAFEDSTRVELVVDGAAVRTATGPNSAPGGSEALQPASWDVSDLVGKTARIQAVDRATGGWGHVSFDAVVFTDRKPVGLVASLSRTIMPTRRYLHIPIKNGAPKRKLTVVVDGRNEPPLDVELADGAPDWFAFRDVSAARGRPVVLSVARVPEDFKGLDSIVESDEIPDAASLYNEPLRPLFHFSARRGWLNDPNGLVYHNGVYRLFFQHNPYGWGWGNMHWGNASSKDLVHWVEIGDALAPDRFGPMFSGSGVVDRKNTSGLGKDGAPPLLFFYTAAGDPTVQCLAYSRDGGETLHKYDGNPIVEQFTAGNRDPKVFFHEPTGKWVMTLYVEAPRKPGRSEPNHTIRFLTSTDAIRWTSESEAEGFFECPDFFELPVEEEPGRTAWVLTAASSEYKVGGFDGKVFTPETPKLAGHRGAGFYAAQTYSDIPAHDGRRVQIGWLQAPSPGMPFNQCMSVPMALTLRRTPAGLRLAWNPVKELASLRRETRTEAPFALAAGESKPLGDHGEAVEIRAEFEPAAEGVVSFDVRGVPVVYDAGAKKITVAGRTAPIPEGAARLAIFLDRTTIEVFVGDGTVYVPAPTIPKRENRAVSVRSDKGGTRFTALEVHRLGSIWGK